MDAWWAKGICEKLSLVDMQPQVEVRNRENGADLARKLISENAHALLHFDVDADGETLGYVEQRDRVDEQDNRNPVAPGRSPAVSRSGPLRQSAVDWLGVGDDDVRSIQKERAETQFETWASEHETQHETWRQEATDPGEGSPKATAYLALTLGGVIDDPWVIVPARPAAGPTGSGNRRVRQVRWRNVRRWWGGLRNRCRSGWRPRLRKYRQRPT